ncbi:hypothetical protein HK100_000781 [Physocladia obscura]|uniref:Uncharacterized protein n=1 Tax=Physocladia obscura TaxID=109957 RepID=A0AAD5SXT8_9FUNG|nr:hypothetical protein HK100_000781 [Physocladia obscura]
MDITTVNGVATPGSPTVARTRSRHVASRYLAHRTPAPVPVLANQKGAAAVALATTKRSKQTTAAIAAATATAMATVAKPVTLSVFKTSMSTRQLRSLTVSGTVASPRRMLRSGTSALRNKPPKFNLPASTSDQLENIPSESASLAAELHRASQPSSKLRQNSALPKTPFIATKKNNLKNNPNPPSPKITDQQETNEPLIVARQTVAHSSPSNNYGATHAISIKQQSSAAIFQYPPGSHQLQQQIHRFSQDPDPFIPTQPSRILAEHLPFLLSSTHGNQKSGVDDREADALLADAQLLQWRLLTAKAKHSFEIRKIEAERQIFQGWQCIQSIKSQIHDLKSEIAARKRMMRDLDALVIQETNLKSIITAIQHFESDYSSLVRGLEASVVRMKMLNVHLSNPVELRDSLIHGTNRINKILESGKTVFSKVQTLTEATTALTRLAAAGKTELAECIDLMTQVSIMKAKEQSYLIEAEQLKSQHS